MFVVLRLQVPGDQLGDAGARRGAKGHNVSPRPVDGDVGNAVLAAAQDGAQVEEGDGAGELNVDDFTAPLVRVSDTKERGGCHLLSKLKFECFDLNPSSLLNFPAFTYEKSG